MFTQNFVHNYQCLGYLCYTCLKVGYSFYQKFTFHSFLYVSIIYDVCARNLL